MRVGPQNCRIFHSWRNATGVVPDLIPNHPSMSTWIMMLLHCNEIKDVGNFITLLRGWSSTLDLLQSVVWWPVTNFLAPHPRYTFQCSTLLLYTAHKYTVIQAIQITFAIYYKSRVCPGGGEAANIHFNGVQSPINNSLPGRGDIWTQILIFGNEK